MRRFKLIVEYDGTRYSGWQFQKNAPSVQAALAGVIEHITSESINLEGASRTDAGVHALGQVAAFNTSSSFSSQNIHKGINALLPPDIAVRELLEVPLEFNPRRDAKEKTYVYKVLNRQIKSPHYDNRVWFVNQPLDVKLMREGARFMLGEKDFSSFRAAGSDATHSIRDIRSLDVERSGDIIEIQVRGKAFLRHMVRIIAGTLVTVGHGKLPPGEIEGIIEARDRTASPLTAPSCGLYLVEILY